MFPAPNNKKQEGIVTIPILIALTLLIIGAGIAVSSVSFNENVITATSDDGAMALRYAESGARDALQKLTRDIEFEDTSGYRIDFASPVSNCASDLKGCAEVKVYSTGDPLLTPSIITVRAQSGSAERFLQVDAVFNYIFKIINTNWNEIKDAPIASTGQATDIESDSLTLNGWININGNSGVTVWFRRWTTWPTRCNDSSTNPSSTRVPTSDSAAGDLSNNYPEPFSAGTGDTLSPETTYYYCAIANDGSGNKIFGQLFGVTTPAE